MEILLVNSLVVKKSGRYLRVKHVTKIFSGEHIKLVPSKV